MAKLTVTLPEDLQLKLSKLGDKTDDICEKVLEAGGEVVLAKVKSNLRTVVGKNTKTPSRSTGELAGSLGLSKPRLKRDSSGYDIKIGFAEPRRGSGKSNAKIATILEYGKHNQPPRPFMKPAKTQSKSAAVAAMENKFNDMVDKL